MLENRMHFKYVKYGWRTEIADRLDAVDRLVYRSNLLGSDRRITNTGGGNTSSKITMPDPLTGAAKAILWVKGSGGDLRSATRAHFASLEMEKLARLKDIYERAADKGPKSPAEDAMVALYPHTAYNLNPRPASIDTALHAFMPYRHVDHTHPHAVIAIAAARHGQKLTREIFGGEIGWVDWQRPGFDLGLALQRQCLQNPNLKGIILGQHGLINWADDDRTCYESGLSIIETAARYIEAHDQGAATFDGQKYPSLSPGRRLALLSALLPKLRGMISQRHKYIATVQYDERILRFVNSHAAPRLAALGTSCPDHFLRTKIQPLFIDWDPARADLETLYERLEEGLAGYRQSYSAYYQACARPDSPPMRDANPTVILIPGLGMIAWGKNKRESQLTAEFYSAAVEVMRGAEAIDEYVALPWQEAFDIEYWSLEEAKLRRLPAEKPFEREIVVVIGAGSGIGKATAQQFGEQGAHVICADLNRAGAAQTAKELAGEAKQTPGGAGSGDSRCGAAIAVAVDVTDRRSVQKLFRRAVRAYGGIDHLVITAGIFAPAGKSTTHRDKMWRATYEVNIFGAHLAADEAAAIWKAQALAGSLVLTTSANAVVAKPGSLAYDTSKAAANHLVRELAIELAPQVRVYGIAPATVVEGSSMFPRERIIDSLKKYRIEFSPRETTEILQQRLAAFYTGRTLLKTAISPKDVAAVICLLCGRRFSKTTGHIVPVDGGLVEAFLR